MPLLRLVSLGVIAAVVALFLLKAETSVAQSSDCSALPEAARLRSQVGPDVVGSCVGDAVTHENGDVSVQTTGGILVRRAADGRVAFTDGFHTWVDGPNGVQKRLNSAWFEWERGPSTTLSGALLPSRRIVAYYGNPLSSAMGVLGEGSPEQMLARLRQQAAAYDALDLSRPVLPALELVAVVAQNNPGPDGMWRARMEDHLIEQVAQWAESNSCLLILDIQTGRSSVAAELEPLLPYLRRPYVHLALDPEFSMTSSQAPGEAIGSMKAAEINYATEKLAELVAEHNIPPKILIVHQFEQEMILNPGAISLNPRVQIVINMDGFGPPAPKIGGYQRFVAEQDIQYAGFKLFYRQDHPMMTPADVLELSPKPDVIIYQ